MSTLHRSRAEELEYREYLKKLTRENVNCVFCNKKYYKVIEEYDFFRKINNIFPYTLWDSCRVIEHTMIVPKRHMDSLSDFNEGEVAEYHSLISLYESQGYDLYSRGHNSHMKSVRHQHTHMIKTDGKKINGIYYNERPLIHITY